MRTHMKIIIRLLCVSKLGGSVSIYLSIYQYYKYQHADDTEYVARCVGVVGVFMTYITDGRQSVSHISITHVMFSERMSRFHDVRHVFGMYIS